MRKRKGSLVVVVLFAMTMSIVSVGMLSVGQALYVTGRRDVAVFSDTQSCKSMMEISVVRYLDDLQSVTVTETINTAWLPTDSSVLYSGALEKIVDAVSTPDGKLVWYRTSAKEILASTTFDNPSALLSLTTLFNRRDGKVHLYLEDIP